MEYLDFIKYNEPYKGSSEPGKTMKYPSKPGVSKNPKKEKPTTGKIKDKTGNKKVSLDDFIFGFSKELSSRKGAAESADVLETSDDGLDYGDFLQSALGEENYTGAGKFDSYQSPSYNNGKQQLRNSLAELDYENIAIGADEDYEMTDVYSDETIGADDFEYDNNANEFDETIGADDFEYDNNADTMDFDEMTGADEFEYTENANDFDETIGADEDYEMTDVYSDETTEADEFNYTENTTEFDDITGTDNFESNSDKESHGRDKDFENNANLNKDDHGQSSPSNNRINHYEREAINNNTYFRQVKGSYDEMNEMVNEYYDRF